MISLFSDSSSQTGFVPKRISEAQRMLSQNSTESSLNLAQDNSPQPRLVKAAHEFEASLMQELMKPLLPGHSSLDGGEETGENSALSSFAGEAFARALSDHGGFGIAKRIINQLTTAGNHSGKTPVPRPFSSSGENAVGK